MASSSILKAFIFHLQYIPKGNYANVICVSTTMGLTRPQWGVKKRDHVAFGRSEGQSLPPWRIQEDRENYDSISTILRQVCKNRRSLYELPRVGPSKAPSNTFFQCLCAAGKEERGGTWVQSQCDRIEALHKMRKTLRVTGAKDIHAGNVILVQSLAFKSIYIHWEPLLCY